MTNAIPEMDAIIEAVGRAMHPKLEAIVHQYCDEAYEAIMVSTQDYLIDNAQFNIGSRISALENENTLLRAEVVAKDALRDALKGLDGILSSAESNASGNPEWQFVSSRINSARAALALAGAA